MSSHKELRELMLICWHATTITAATTTTLFQYSRALVRGITYYSKQFSIHTFHLKVSLKHTIKISEFIRFIWILSFVP